MTIQELKTQIESNTVSDAPIIFKDSENGFVANQYIHAIAKSRNLEIEYINDLNDVLLDINDIFSSPIEKNASKLNVLKSEVYLWGASDFSQLNNLIIVVSKFSDKSVEKQLERYIVKVPKLEPWMIKDYVYSTTTGVDTKDLDKILMLCGNNYYRLQNELDKISLFSEVERKYLVSAMFQDCAFEDLSSYNIFNFTNAITSRDVNSVMSIYKELDRVDINEFGLLTILLKNFRNMIMVQTSTNPTPESTGLDNKTLYAIKKLPRVFSAEQLVKIYVVLLDIDRQIKSGELPVEIVIDYMIVKILSM